MISETDEYCVMNRNVVATHKAIKTDIAKKESKTLQKRKAKHCRKEKKPIIQLSLYRFLPIAILCAGFLEPCTEDAAILTIFVKLKI